MPRKKKDETPDTQPTPPAASTQPKAPSRARAAKAPTPTPEPAEPAPKARAPRAAAAKKSEKPAEPETPKATRAKAKPAPEPTPAAPAETSKKTRTRAKAAEPSAEAESLVAEFRPRPAAKTKPTPEPAAEVSSEKPATRGRSRRDRKPTEPTSDPIPARSAETEDGLPIPVWRTRSKEESRPAAPSAHEDRPQPTAEGGAEPDLAPRRSRSRRRRERDDQDVSAADALAPATVEDSTARPEEGRRRRRRRGRGESEEATLVASPESAAPPRERRAPKPSPVAERPARPEREPIPVPEDAPQIVVIDGLPTLVRDKRVYPSVFFHAAAPDAETWATVRDEVRLASEHGVHVFSILLELDVDPDAVDDAVRFAGYMLRQLRAVDPEAQVIFRASFLAPSGWEDRYRKARYVAEEGGIAEPSVSDDEFWSVAESCLSTFVRKLRMLDKEGSVMGVHLERGEWFFAAGSGYDTSVAARDAFQDWLRQRYRGDVPSLRAAWYDGQVQFETVSVPEFDPGTRKGEEFVRTGRRSRRWVDYHLFLSDTTVARIARLAYAVKAASEGRYLVGVSYGYTFEWSHPASGHLSLGKLLRCPDVDYISGPPSYKTREPGGTAAFPGPIDSFALNGKLFVSEEDFKTPISRGHETDTFNPVMKTPQALESAHWRGAGAALAHASGVTWMDTWGNGWLSSAGIWERGQAVREALMWRLNDPVSAPDVAVFIDERSLAYLVDERAFEALVQNVREAVLRSGLSVGFYLLSDLAHRENFPESRLHVFVNAWDIRPEVRSAIKSRLQRDGKVLFWLYAAGLFEGGRESLERVREVTGIALRPQPFHSKSGTAILNFRDPICQSLPERQMAQGGMLEPSYFAIPEDATILGEYGQTGLPSFVVRNFEGDTADQAWTSVFLGEPVVTAGLFRALGQMAGAHVWSFNNDVVHVRAPFLTVHCTGAGARTIALPDKWTAFSLNTREWATVEAGGLRFPALDGSTHTFLVGLKSEIEAILNSDESRLLRIEGIAPRAENTLHWDAMQFDVPIMKLDEWVEETWSEDLADDLLLKPSMLDVESASEEAEEEETPRFRGGRRRRRRRGGRGGRENGGAEETAYARREGADRQADAESGIHVMFRKRE